MNTIYITIAIGIIAVLMTFFSYFLAVRQRIKDAAPGAINDAEDTGRAGAEKMEIAVEQIYSLVPAVFKGIFTKDLIKQIVQEIFNKIEEFAKKQAVKGG